MTLIVISEICFVTWIGEMTHHPFFVWGLFLVYYIFYFPAHSPSFRKSKFLQWILPDVEVSGPGMHLTCDPAKKCCGECIPLGKDARAIFGVHPHGLHAVTAICAFSRGEVNIKRKIAGHSALFKIPIVREFCALGGGIHADKDVMVKTLKANQQVVVCPGALRELKKDSKIRERNGFIEVAAEAGETVIIPAWAPDETSLYDLWLPFGTFFLDKIKMRYPWIIISFGKRWLPFWPKNLGRPLKLYVGEAINVNKDDIAGTRSKFYEVMDKLKEMADKDNEENV